MQKLGHSGNTFARFSQWTGFHHWGPQYSEGVIVFSLHIYMAKIVDSGNTYGRFLKIFLLKSELKGLKAVLFHKKKTLAVVPRRMIGQNMQNFMKDTIDSCSKIDYNKAENL